jgi:hypothetical protein
LSGAEMPPDVRVRNNTSGHGEQAKSEDGDEDPPSLQKSGHGGEKSNDYRRRSRVYWFRDEFRTEVFGRPEGSVFSEEPTSVQSESASPEARLDGKLPTKWIGPANLLFSSPLFSW